MPESTDPTTYFSDRVDDYVRHRPSYPDDAFRVIVPERGLRVLDVGCGTGISTRGLLAAGAEVVAIDPNDAMRAAAARELARDGATVAFAPGTGEATGQPDHAFDRVLCAQSFHWFDADRALAEFRRVLRPRRRARADVE